MKAASIAVAAVVVVAADADAVADCYKCWPELDLKSSPNCDKATESLRWIHPNVSIP